MRGRVFFVLVLLIVGSAVFETMGISMFLPILEGGEPESRFSQIVAETFAFFHIPFNFASVIVVMAVFFLLKGVFFILKDGFIGKTTADLLNDLRDEIVNKIFQADYQYLINKDKGYLNNAVTVEMKNLSFAYQKFARVVSEILFGLIFLVIPLILKPYMTGIVFLIGIPFYFVIVKINAWTKDYAKQRSDHSAGIQDMLIQVLNNLKYLKSSAYDDHMIERVEEESEKLSDLQFKQSILQAITSGGFQSFGVVVISGLLYFQAEYVGASIIETVFVLYLLKRSISSLLQIQQQYRKFLTSMGSIDVYDSLANSLADHQESLNSDAPSPDLSKPITFSDVTFAYDDGDRALEDINLRIEPKQSMGIIGSTGAGKTTLITLLTGILEPTDGEILVGSDPIKDLNKRALRRNIGYLTQEPVMFSDTIRNNISMWDPDAPEERVRSAAERASINDYIEGLPEGYDTELGNEGVNLSGGQRQRICIARELYKDATFYIFDEAASSLDAHTEQKIYQSLTELGKDHTLLIVTHRLSSVIGCDQIVVLKEGRMVERGTAQELFEEEGEFASLAENQNITPSVANE